MKKTNEYKCIQWEKDMYSVQYTIHIYIQIQINVRSIYSVIAISHTISKSSLSYLQYIQCNEFF